MLVSEMRAYISDVYEGVKWKAKVAKMSDNQVMAIYYNFIERVKRSERAKIKEREIKEARKHGFISDASNNFKQISFDDILGGRI